MKIIDTVIDCKRPKLFKVFKIIIHFLVDIGHEPLGAKLALLANKLCWKERKLVKPIIRK